MVPSGSTGPHTDPCLTNVQWSVIWEAVVLTLLFMRGWQSLILWTAALSNRVVEKPLTVMQMTVQPALALWMVMSSFCQGILATA